MTNNISDDLIAQFKFLDSQIKEVEQALIERRGAKFMLEQYVARTYGLVPGDTIDIEDGSIKRAEKPNAPTKVE